MNSNAIQQIFINSSKDFVSNNFVTSEQMKTINAICNCKTGSLGVNVCHCDVCGNVEFHNNSCRNRNCPICQAVKKELWVDKRRAEVVDAPYFHVVFTLPHELNSLLYHNQKLLYDFFHKCCAETLLELSSNKKFLGATPGIIQVLHTWNQTLDYHVHMHCIVSGGGITVSKKFRKSKNDFFIPVNVLRDKFKGKFLYYLNKLYQSNSLFIPKSIAYLSKPVDWLSFKDSLYQIDWCPYIKETFNGFGNAIEYLGRYTNKIAISNSRIVSCSDSHVTFSARALHKNEPRRTISLTNIEFIRRFIMHVLPRGFQKIRYYGFLNNRMKKTNLRLIFKLQGQQKFKELYADLSIPEIIKIVWNKDICLCPKCGNSSMRMSGKSPFNTG